ncbi:MAG: TIGR03905 family TSCPD domain-containing protein [Oscillospiraceae bacterium]|nr:TIGR03905 family TSCPD domain-containing protein [Oscillospiraceae bacterium]
MTYSYAPNGVCATNISIELEDGIVQNVVFTDGCKGNALGIAALCRGQSPEALIEKLKGIRCGRKQTSCPDQLAKALESVNALKL